MLEPENDSAVVAEVALVLVAMSKAVAEPREHEIKLRGPDGEVLGHRNVDASTDDEIEGIIAWVVGGDTGGLASLEQILVGIGVCAAK